MPPTILLSCESVSKTYGVKALFTDLSLALFEGNHAGLVGPNGSGKSTLLKILAGLETPDRGTRTIRRQFASGMFRRNRCFLTTERSKISCHRFWRKTTVIRTNTPD